MPPPVRTHVTLFRRTRTGIEAAGLVPSANVYIDLTVKHSQVVGGKTYFLAYFIPEGGQAPGLRKAEFYVLEAQVKDLSI